MNLEELLKRDEYLFLNDLIKSNRVLFLCLSGSYSHGTNTIKSDIDIRGVMLEELTDLVGTTSFEQYTDPNTDTVIYSFKKFIDLLSKSNPSILEMLFCERNHYLYVSELGQILLENRKLFLTKNAILTFKGFARSQLNRFENALVQKGTVLCVNETLTHINRSLKNAMSQFPEVSEEMVNSYVLNDELVVDFNLKAFPIERLHSITQTLTDVKRTYNKQLKQSLEIKDDYHFNKHMMHTIRLYYMLIELLETGDMHTYRLNEKEELLQIKDGFYRDSNGGVKKEFYKLLEELNDRTEKAILTTSLPKTLNKEELDNLVLTIYKKGML